MGSPPSLDSSPLRSARPGRSGLGPLPSDWRRASKLTLLLRRVDLVRLEALASAWGIAVGTAGYGIVAQALEDAEKRGAIPSSAEALESAGQRVGARNPLPEAAQDRSGATISDPEDTGVPPKSGDLGESLGD